MNLRAWIWFRYALLVGNLLAPVFAVGMTCLGHPIIGFGVGVSIYLALHWAVFAPTSCWLGPVVSSFAPEKGDEVWITIDDGPDPQDTPAILDVLRARKAQVTFFFIGEKAAQYPDLVRRAAEEGHGIGNHSFSHPAASMWLYPPGAVAREVDQGRAAILQAAAITGPLPFRAPAGNKSPFLHGKLAPGERVVAWSARAFDTCCREPQKVVARLMRGARPGAIMLMHEGVVARDGSRLGPQVLAQLLAELEKKGLRAVVPESGSWR